MRGMARTAVVAGTATVVSGRVHQHQHEKWASEEQEKYDQQMAVQQQAPQVAPGPPPAPEDDLIDKIKEDDDVTFELTEGRKGLNAVSVKLI